MKKVLTAIVFTANLMVLQGFSPIQSAYAQSAQDLQIEETASLTKTESGAIEIPGVGGSQEEIANAEALTPIEGEAESLENSNTLEAQENFINISVIRETVRSCDVNGFPIIILCDRF